MVCIEADARKVNDGFRMGTTYEPHRNIGVRRDPPSIKIANEYRPGGCGMPETLRWPFFNTAWGKETQYCGICRCNPMRETLLSGRELLCGCCAEVIWGSDWDPFTFEAELPAPTWLNRNIDLKA